jgi:hypothetical protein
MLSMRVPGFINDQGEANVWAAIMHPYTFHDISESGNVDAIGTYQNAGIHLNFELAQVGPFRLVVSPNAKTFFGAGMDNSGTNYASTLSTTTPQLATAFGTAASAASKTETVPWTIGVEETANVHYPANEQIMVTTASGTGVTAFIGQAENGGLRFEHASGEAVRNGDSVYTIVFGGPGSLVKLFAPSVGEYGEVVGPKVSGLAEQFSSIAWKFYGSYNRLTENVLLRGEFSSSYEA